MSRRASSEAAWEREYRAKGRLWRGVRLDPLTIRVLEGTPELRSGYWLDAGCGDGKGLVPLASELDPAGSVVGLDASRAALRIARRALAEAGAQRAACRLVRGDVRAPPFLESAFDAVRAVHVVGHLRAADRPLAFAALAALARPGGRLVVMEFGTRDFRAAKGQPVEPGMMRRGTGIETHYFSREELENLVRDADLRLVALDSQEFEVEYAGERLLRQRWDLVAERRDGSASGERAESG